jgi:hypothetical protein
VEQPQIEYDVWWSPVNLSTWASVHSCADERVLSGVVTRSAPNGCWLQHHVRLWSEDLAQEHLFIFGNVDGGEATGQQLFCDGNDIVDDYSSVC